MREDLGVELGKQQLKRRPAVPIGDDIGVCFDYTQFQYDSNDDMSLDADWPSCTTLSNGDADGDQIPDHLMWGCGPMPSP